jgi:hypothetical protein
MNYKLQISPSLVVRLGDARVPLTPRESFVLAERLIRAATRKMVLEEAEAATSTPRLEKGDHHV